MSKLLDVHHASDPTPRAAAVPREINLARVSRHLVVGDFTASMAHEVRQPLTAIIANAETCLRMLRGTPEADEIIAALNDIVDAGHRANQLMRRNGDLLRDPPATKDRRRHHRSHPRSHVPGEGAPAGQRRQAQPVADRRADGRRQSSRAAARDAEPDRERPDGHGSTRARRARRSRSRRSVTPEGMIMVTVDDTRHRPRRRRPRSDLPAVPHDQAVGARHGPADQPA